MSIQGVNYVWHSYSHRDQDWAWRDYIVAQWEGMSAVVIEIDNDGKPLIGVAPVWMPISVLRFGYAESDPATKAPAAA